MDRDIRNIKHHNLTLLFDGRTLVVECVFERTTLDKMIVAEAARRAAGGPLLRMTMGGLSMVDGQFITKTLVNTDEDEWTVAKRVNNMRPRPLLVTIGIADAKDAAEAWGELQRIQQDHLS